MTDKISPTKVIAKVGSLVTDDGELVEFSKGFLDNLVKNWAKVKKDGKSGDKYFEPEYRDGHDWEHKTTPVAKIEKLSFDGSNLIAESADFNTELVTSIGVEVIDGQPFLDHVALTDVPRQENLGPFLRIAAARDGKNLYSVADLIAAKNTEIANKDQEIIRISASYDALKPKEIPSEQLVLRNEVRFMKLNEYIAQGKMTPAEAAKATQVYIQRIEAGPSDAFADLLSVYDQHPKSDMTIDLSKVHEVTDSLKQEAKEIKGSEMTTDPTAYYAKLFGPKL